MRAAFLALALLGACTTQASAPQGPLPGSEWSLIGEATPAPSIAFTDRGASGFAGCNRWFSSAARNGAALSFGNVGLTRMACPAPQMQTERAFVDALGATQGARLEGEELVLLDSAGGELARLRRTN
jgi:heat shock protein HslJ